MSKTKIIYNVFQTNATEGKDILNDIIKGTKSILASKNGYKRYIRDYFVSTKLSTFKSPEITEYPLLKTNTSYLIPITTKKFKENERKKIFKPNLFLETELFKKNNINYLEDFNKRLNRLIKYNEEVKTTKNHYNKTFYENKGRYNSLFLDFFNKWKDYNNKHNTRYASSYDKSSLEKNTINEGNLLAGFQIKEKYNGLHYDEKEIFDNNYDVFIMEKLNYVKQNKIKNFSTEIKSTFYDSNEKKIKLKLESIKLTFYPKTKENSNIYHEFYVFIPLSYVFLFYSYDFSFFQKILMSLLIFDNNYKTINFKDDGFMTLLNELSEDNKEFEVEDVLSNYNSKNNSKHDSPKKNENDMRKTFNTNNNFAMRFFRKSSTKLIHEVAKTKVIHSNKKFVNSIVKNRDPLIKRIDKSNKNKISYNEYFFIWETSAVTYEVKMEMPRIYFSYQNLDYNIFAFCEKNLFLYLYQNNFINWDFYALNYLFSFKYFRKVIIKFFSLNKNKSFFDNNFFPNIKEVNTSNFNTQFNFNIPEENTSDKVGDEGNKDILIAKKKVLNQMSENNESYMFFYTDQNYSNYIINLFSYKIHIVYEKLNPLLNWEFYLNFKQMRYLNEVSKYEDLLTFLPKIIVTNFEIGDLSINFDIFSNNFNAKILQNEAGHNVTKKKQLKIDISIPYIESEKIGVRREKKLEKELSFNLLQSLNQLKMKHWSRKILSIMKKDLLYKSHRASDIFTNKLNFFKKSPEKDDMIKRSFNFNKKKTTFFGGHKTTNFDD